MHRPREITWGDERLAITSLAAVRHEDSAYPVGIGPRTLFDQTQPSAPGGSRSSRVCTPEAGEDQGRLARAPDGHLSFADGISGAGKYVELKAEMDVMVLISNCPQLNNPCNGYNPTPIRLLIWD